MSEALAHAGIVYVVDDDPSMCDLIAAALGHAGLLVRAYPSADAFAGVEMVGEAPELPRCLLLDLEMPGMSGLDFLEQRFQGKMPCPVIVITAKATVEAAVRSMKLGAVDFLEKPFSTETLKSVVMETLRKHPARPSGAAQGEGRDAVRGRLGLLSPREKELLDAIIQGKSTKMIADLLGISTRTVDHHRANLMAKMHAANVADLVRMAVQADYRSV